MLLLFDSEEPFLNFYPNIPCVPQLGQLLLMCIVIKRAKG